MHEFAGRTRVKHANPQPDAERVQKQKQQKMQGNAKFNAYNKYQAK